MGLTRGSGDSAMAQLAWQTHQLKLFKVALFQVATRFDSLTYYATDYKAGVEWIQGQIEEDATGLTDDIRFWVAVTAI